MALVVVVGAGVIGLSTAAALRDAGHRVRVVAAARAEGTTSWAAGALWFPFACDPRELVVRWAGRTRVWLEELASSDPGAGVDVLELEEWAATPEVPWWAEAAGPVRLERRDDGPGRATGYVWRTRAPRVEPRLFLAWLERGLPEPVRIERVDDLGSLRRREGADLVVNCAGLGARALTGDASLRAIYGQTVIAEPGGVDLGRAVEDDRDATRLFYAIPRRGEVVLGGVAEPCEDDRPAVPTDETARVLVARCAAYGVRAGAVRGLSAGLRPYRPSVRLEVDPSDRNVIHHYGHGGAGYTLCRGGAEDVVTLVGAARTGD